MSISFITGKPGGGKGLLAMQQIVDELVKGSRPIITNLAVQIEPWINGGHQPMMGLRAYLLRQFKKDFDVRQRVHVLSDDDIAAFYLWRVVGTNGERRLQKADAVVQKSRDGDEKIIEFDTTLGRESGPVLYVVDEAWKFYGARSWQKTGEGVLFYNAQHRKFGDDVLVVTQHTKQIDPAIHRVAQDFWVVTNHSKLSMGMFRQPDIFSVAIYDQAPTGSQLRPMSRKLFKLDKSGLAQTYDTSAGVGLTGRAIADIGSRKKGLPWWGMIFALGLVGCLMWQVPKLLGWWVGHTLKKAVVPKKNAPGFAPRPVPVSLPAGEPRTGTNTLAQSQKPEESPVVMTGYAFVNGKWNVYLSDGRSYESGDGSFQVVTRHYCIIEGRRYEMNRRTAPVPAVPEQRQPNEIESVRRDVEPSQPSSQSWTRRLKVISVEKDGSETVIRPDGFVIKP